MAQITLNCPDNKVDYVATHLGWPGQAAPGETKPQFLRRRIMELVKNEVSERDVSIKRAAQAADTLDLT